MFKVSCTNPNEQGHIRDHAGEHVGRVRVEGPIILLSVHPNNEVLKGKEKVKEASLG
jgi:hypothetical protein